MKLVKKKGAVAEALCKTLTGAGGNAFATPVTLLRKISAAISFDWSANGTTKRAKHRVIHCAKTDRQPQVAHDVGDVLLTRAPRDSISNVIVNGMESVGGRFKPSSENSCKKRKNANECSRAKTSLCKKSRQQKNLRYKNLLVAWRHSKYNLLGELECSFDLLVTFSEL